MKKILMMLLGVAFATFAWALDPVTYMTWNEESKLLVEANTTSYEVVTADTATFEDKKWYVVNDTVERDSSITVTGSAHLILCDGASLTVTGWDFKAGIEVPTGKSLTIYGQTEGTGALEAWGDTFCAGIGGSENGSCGTITINGGKITATGEQFGAGIGGCKDCSSAATITINGGEIEAIGGYGCAGIGSGCYNGSSVSRSDTDLITINGGTIKATGGSYGAGIGSGDSGFAATVVINGGEITASSKDADAIGKGEDAKAATVTFGEGAEVSIKAGATEDSATETAVDAFVANHTAKYAEIVVTPPDTIEYLKWDESTKALVAANTRNYTVVTKDTAAFEDKKWYVVTNTIERGSITVNGAAHLILCDGAKLTVKDSTSNRAGIRVVSGNSLTIYGQSKGTGTLNATGTAGAAGIGSPGGGNRDAGTVTINGGVIEASSKDGVGIGGGPSGAGGTVTINGGTITATGAQSCAGIGAGQGASALARTTVTFATDVEFSIVAGDDEASATATTVADYVADHSARYVKIEVAASTPKVTLDEIIDGEDWTKFDVAYTLENLEEGVDYTVLIEVTASGVTKSITNETDIVIGSFTNSVDTVQLFGGKVFDEEAKVKVSVGTWKELKWTQLWKDGPFFAECNVGATKPEEAGETYTFDEAQKALTAPMRLLANGEITTLDKTVNVTWDGDKNGVNITGLDDYESNSIFLPAASDYWTSTAYSTGVKAYYFGVRENDGSYYVTQGSTLLTDEYHVRAVVDPKNVDSVRKIFDPISTEEETVELLAPPVEYLNWDGAKFVTATNRTYDVVTAQTKTFEDKMWYIVTNDVTCGSIAVKGDVKLILSDGATLTVTGRDGASAIAVAARKTLTIYGQAEGTGKLIATGAGKAPAISGAINCSALASSHVWAGASATTCEGMTTAAFAKDHSAAYVELPVETYEVAYDANGATGVMSNSVFAVAKEVTLKKNAFTALGYDFAGWTTNGTDVVYADEEKGTDFATTNDTLTLTATWNVSTNGVTATDFTSFTNLLAQAAAQSASLPVTIGFGSGVVIPAGETVTLPTSGAYAGIEFVADEGESELWLDDGVLYGDAMRGEVTVDALQLMKLANGGVVPSAFKVLSEGTGGTTVTNDVVMLLGDDGKAYNSLAAVLAAAPRPETVKLFEVEAYTISYDANGGKGEEMPSQEMALGKSICLERNTYTRAGYVFLGWSTDKTATTPSIYNSGTVKNLVRGADTSVTLYAVWKQPAKTEYTIEFVKNEGSGSLVSCVFTHGTKQTLPTLRNLKWERDGYEFLGWATTTADAREGKVWKANGGAVASPVAPGKKLTVYAIWKLKSGYYEVRYWKNDKPTAPGTDNWRTVAYPYGKGKVMPTVANGLKWTRDGYAFGGWATSRAKAEAGIVWKTDAATLVTAAADGKTLHVYAIWNPLLKVSPKMRAAMPMVYSVASTAPAFTVEAPIAEAMYFHGLTVDGTGIYDLIVDEDGETGFVRIETEEGVISGDCEVEVLENELIVNLDGIAYVLAK